MALKTYDAKQVTVIFGGRILTGYADGEFCTVEYAEPRWNHTAGADGEEARSKVNNNSAICRVRLLQTSDSNRILAQDAEADRASNAGVKPLMVQDKSGNSIHVSEEAYIEEVPSAPYGKEVGEREWVFRMTNARHFIGGN